MWSHARWVASAAASCSYILPQGGLKCSPTLQARLLAADWLQAVCRGHTWARRRGPIPGAWPPDRTMPTRRVLAQPFVLGPEDLDPFTRLALPLVYVPFAPFRCVKLVVGLRTTGSWPAGVCFKNMSTTGSTAAQRAAP